MIYDVFLLNDEIDLLLVRLHEHDAYVDKFVIVQADKTHSGLEKQILLKPGDPRLQDFETKIVWLNVALEAAPKFAVENENKQRDAFIHEISFKPDDIVLMSDLDEIVSSKHWPYLLDRMKSEFIVSIWMKLFYYCVNLEVDTKWQIAKLMRAQYFQKLQLSSRQIRSDIPSIVTPFPCGWHFSYLMEPQKIAEKIRSFQHTELNQDKFTNLNNIAEARKWRKHLFGNAVRFRVLRDESFLPERMKVRPEWQSFFDRRRNPLIAVVQSYYYFLAVVRVWIQDIKVLIVRLTRLQLFVKKPQGELSSSKSDLFEQMKPGFVDPRLWLSYKNFFESILEGRPECSAIGFYLAIFTELVKARVLGSIKLVGIHDPFIGIAVSRAASLVDATVLIESPKRVPPDSIESRRYADMILKFGCRNCAFDPILLGEGSTIGAIFWDLDENDAPNLGSFDLESKIASNCLFMARSKSLLEKILSNSKFKIEDFSSSSSCPSLWLARICPN